MYLSATGYVQVHTFTSYARIPLEGTAITMTDSEGNPFAMRLTNRSGLLDQPVAVKVPDLSESQSPDPPERPYGVIDIYARLEDYELIHVEQVQVFADTVTTQDLEMIPLSEFPESWNKQETFFTTPQAL